jgi:hypothetical protein
MRVARLMAGGSPIFGFSKMNQQRWRMPFVNKTLLESSSLKEEEVSTAKYRSLQEPQA